MAEGRYGPKGITLEELEKQMADLRAEVHRLSPEGTDKKQQASGGGHSENTGPIGGGERPFSRDGFASGHPRLNSMNGSRCDNEP
jgi:hypothetical protein